MNLNNKHDASLLITLIIAVLNIKTAQSLTPAGSKIYPVISNATALELLIGSDVRATWPVPKASTYKIWVKIPTGSNASNATYWVYPKGKAIGSTACDSTDPNHPCYPMTVDQSTAINGWVQLKINNLVSTAWVFTSAGLVTASASSLGNAEQLGLAQVLYRDVTPAPALAIGQVYKGGKIFYLDSTQQHGLVVAATTFVDVPWWNGAYVATRATGTVIGTGRANTTAIVQSQGAGSYAAKLCDDLVLNGFSDWYLPSKDELTQLYLNRSAIGDLAKFFYWSSTEFDNYNAWFENIPIGYDSNFSKGNLLAVRAIRAF